MTERLNIYHVSETTQLNVFSHIDRDSQKYCGLQWISFCYNFHNVRGVFGNNTLKLFIGDIIRTIPDGTYSLTLFNKYLYNVISGFYYKIEVSLTGNHYDIVRYASINDRNNGINGTIMVNENDLSSLPILNSEIWYGTIFNERIKI